MKLESSNPLSKTLIDDLLSDSLDQLKDTVDEHIGRPDPRVPGLFQRGDIVAGLYEVIDSRSGGMGRVDFVWHRGWNINLIVKTPKEFIWKNEKARASYIKEADTWIGLGKHPNITTAFYVREIDHIPRIIAEFADGGTLEEWIAKHDLGSWDSSLDVAIQIVDGLAYAHRKGLVHRDLKPANILLWKDGTAKLTDFGLSIASSENRPNSKKVQSGRLVGTPAYAAPEQWLAADQVAFQADVYALGLILFELFTGHSPYFLSAQEREILQKPQQNPNQANRPQYLKIWKNRHTKEQPEILSGVRPNAPKELEEIISACLIKDPSQRLAKLEDVREVLVGLYEKYAHQPYYRQAVDDIVLRAADLNNRGASYIDLGRVEDARLQFELALKLDPQHSEASYNLAYLKWRKGEYSDDEFTTDVGLLDQDQLQNRFRHSLCYIAQQDLKAAKDELNSILKQSPTFGDGFKYLGISQLGLGEIAEADVSLKEAHRLLPQDPDITHYRRLLGHPKEIKRVTYEFQDHLSSPEGYSLVGIDAPNSTAIWSREQSMIECEIVSGRKRAEMIVPFEINMVHKIAALGNGIVIIGNRQKFRGTILDVRTGNLVGEVPLPEYLFIGKDIGLKLSWVNGKLYCLSQGTGRFNYQHLMYCPLGGISTIPQIPAELTTFCFNEQRHLFITGKEDAVELWGHGFYSSSNILTDERMGKIQQVNLLAGLQPGIDFALTCSNDGLVRLWELTFDITSTTKEIYYNKTRCIRRFKGHRNHVVLQAVANPSGTRIASCGHDQTVRIWDWQSGVCLRTLPFSIDWDTQLAFINNHTLVISRAGEQSSILRLPELPLNIPFELSMPRTVKESLSVEEIVQLKLVAASNQMEQKQYQLSYQTLREAQTSPEYILDNTILDELARLWQYGQKKGIRAVWNSHTLEEEYPITALLPLEANRLLAGTGGVVACLNWKENQKLSSLVGHSSKITSLSSDKSGHWVFSTDEYSGGRIWNLTAVKPTGLLKHGQGANFGKVNQHWTRAITSKEDSLTIWDLEIEEIDHVCKLEAAIVGIDIEPEGKFALAVLSNGSLQRIGLFDTSQQVLGQLPQKDISTAIFDNSCQKILLFNASSAEPIITGLNGHVRFRLTGLSTVKYGVFFDQDHLLALCGEKEIWIHMLEDRNCQLLYHGPTGEGKVQALAVESSGRYIYTGEDTGKIRAWEIDYEMRYEE